MKRILPMKLLARGFTAFGLLYAAAVAAEPFTVIHLPDTQNYVDFTQQKSAGFALDGVDLYMEQMRYIAGRSEANGGDVAFVAAVGDVWQHVLRDSDPGHAARGFPSLGADASFAALIAPKETLEFEIPHAVAGYRLLAAANLRFGVPPGNHDYDAWWSAPVAGAVADPDDEEALAALPPEQRQVHIGGFDAFRGALGADSEFFKGKDWYVSAHDGGSSSAQVFEAGGYRFLNLALEMHAGNDVLAWAESVLAAHPGLPTIISTHDFLNPRSERKPSASIDLASADPGFNNSAEMIWENFIRKHDQVFLVLSGHQAGQGLRVDANDAGHAVYQMLADYQNRGQVALDAGQPAGANGRPPVLGDGWLRELQFNLDGASPSLLVRTYSTHYKAYSSDLPAYTQWYRQWEQPNMSDAEFLAADEFELDLGDFRERFGAPAE
jgi:hypothetical protein